MKKYNYVYVTTNLINGAQYVGDHSTNNLNDDYLGSGKYLFRSIKKYKKKILKLSQEKFQRFRSLIGKN